MKVLLVVHGFPPGALGGTELHAEAHAIALARDHGDEVLVLTREHDTTRPEYAVRSERRAGFTVTFINNTFGATRHFSESYAHPAVEAVAAPVIDDFRPDVAHIHHLTCLSTGIVEHLAGRGVRTLMSLHDYWMLCHRGQLFDRSLRRCAGPDGGCTNCVMAPVTSGSLGHAGKAAARRAAGWLPASWRSAGLGWAAQLRARVEGAAPVLQEARFEHMRGILQRPARLFAPSRYLRDRFVAAGVEAERLILSEYGVERRLHPTPPQPARTPLRLGFVGSLMVSKGPHVLLEAAKRLPAGRVQVDLFGAFTPYHGDSSYQDVLQPLLQQPGVRAHGAWPHADMDRVFASIDVLVVPSLWAENSPFVIREALAAGVPVVASEVGGIPETVVDGRNGVLFPPGDVPALVTVLEALLDGGERLAALRSGIQALPTIAEHVASMRGFYRDRACT